MSELVKPSSFLDLQQRDRFYRANARFDTYSRRKLQRSARSSLDRRDDFYKVRMKEIRLT
ncbi:hypothetical protein Plhal304r1_c046g0127041 [Plasmopara halstedii]